MAVEKKLGTEDNPDIKVQGSAVEIIPDTTRDEQIRQAAEILVNEQEVLIDAEIQPQQAPVMSFDANLVDFLSDEVLQKIGSDILSSIKGDKQSRSEWEKTYTDGLKYLGMKFPESKQ